jgi:hypothetical protein
MGDQGLCFEGDDGTTHPVSGDQLARLFHLVNEHVHCVILNACYSKDQAAAISNNIDYVIGMSDAIGDEAAIKFAQGFYEAFWEGRAYEKAFKFGCSAIDMANIPEEHVPVILRSQRLGGLKLEYSDSTQRIENFLMKYCNSPAKERALLCLDSDEVLPLRNYPETALAL